MTYRDLIRVRFTRVSTNFKTGPIPVSTSSSDTCPDSCPLKKCGCYGKSGNLSRIWKETDAGEFTCPWNTFLGQIRTLPRNQLWRHNQAGDLPGRNERINGRMLQELVRANQGRKGFTYTHKRMELKGNREAVAAANAGGFVINLSADNLWEADHLASFNVGPVVVVLPKDQRKNLVTPKGRKVVICPFYTHDVQCLDCGLCARADRTCIVGLPAHGYARNIVSEIAKTQSK